MTLEKIRREVEYATGVNVKETSSRQRKVVEAKALFTELCDRFTNTSFTYLGAFLKMNHSSLFHYKKNDYFANYSTYSYKSERIGLIQKIKNIVQEVNDVPSIENEIFDLELRISYLMRRKREIENNA